MAARTPRRSFATPFVITLAAVPACYVQSSQPAPQPQEPQQQQPEHRPVVVSNPPRPQSDPATPPPQDSPNLSAIHNPPRPQPQPQTQPQAQQSWTVRKTKDGCEVTSKIDCPPGAMCNPPPPHAVDCPPDIVMNKPLTIVSQPDGTCVVEREPPKCPPHAMCNPPRPQTVTCPK